VVRGDDSPAHADVSHGALRVLRVSVGGKDFHDCGRPCDAHDVRLRDRVGAEHPLKADAGCRNTVFNSQAQTGAEFVERLLALGVRHFRVEFLNEPPAEVVETPVTGSCCAAKSPARNTGSGQIDAGQVRGEIFASRHAALARKLKLFYNWVQLGVTGSRPDGAGNTDVALNALMELLHGELMRRQASPLFVQGLAQATAIHLARNYADPVRELRRGSPSLPGYKLRQITDWMAGHLAEDFNLDQLAARAGLSKFYFNRLFKNAMNMSPSRYQITLRMDEARRLLRETKKSVVEVALDVGYANPSHFAQLFRRETGLAPSDYRRQR
jgi:AraC-like DNA-binding protein